MELRNLITGQPEADVDLTDIGGLDPAIDNLTPEDLANEDLAKLLNDLRIAYRNAGEPSFRNLAILTNRQLSASTISRMFKARTPPKWKSLAFLLRALNVPQRETARWHAQWAKAVNKIKPIVDPDLAHEVQASAPALATPCLQCGALVADADIHREWHQKLAQAEGLLGALEQRSNRMSQLPTSNGSLVATRPARGGPPPDDPRAAVPRRRG
jgi:hypothetical protein